LRLGWSTRIWLAGFVMVCAPLMNVWAIYLRNVQHVRLVHSVWLNIPRMAWAGCLPN
jgi:hypothetical protein